MPADIADSRPVIAVTMGDPAGVGPEVVVGAVGDPDVVAVCRPVVIGDRARLETAARLMNAPIPSDIVDLGNVDPALPFGELSAAAGHAAFEYLERAVAMVRDGEAAGICTAPLNKAALHAAGHEYPGHTELLADLFGAGEVSMMLSAPGLRVIHVTTHVGLAEATTLLEADLVARTILRGDAALRRAGFAAPRIGVAAVNPHAGENGLFGVGEEARIAAGVESARAAGADVSGPWPADTLFHRAVRGDFDLVVAMYHDQGHIPIKVLGLDEGVNITVGLPVIRTSVDHGTAFDIAGTGRAQAGSMRAALLEAARLAAA